MQLELPYPPSVNRYWRRAGRHIHISREGRKFRASVVGLVAGSRWTRPLDGRLVVGIEVFPPDRRRRDLDNVCKAILDALEHAGVYEDDCQIDDLRVLRRERVPGGKVVVSVKEMTG